MLKLILPLVALLAVSGGLAYWTYGRGDDSAEAEVQVTRWVNVTVAVPEESGLTVVQTFSGPRADRPAMYIQSRQNGSSKIVIDAETGAVLWDYVEPEDRAAVNQVLETMAVSELDRSAAPWPYSGEPPNVPRERLGNITYIRPDPAAGISINFVIADGLGASASFIVVRNGQSALAIDTASGDVDWETAEIAPEDKDAFDRFLSTVEYAGPRSLSSRRAGPVP